MKNYYKFITCRFLIGCSDGPVAFENDEIEVIAIGKDQRVFNKINRSIFYFVVERETASRLDWIPVSREENEIKARDGKAIPLEDILGYKKGKEVLFYYWSSTDPGSSKINSIIHRNR